MKHLVSTVMFIISAALGHGQSKPVYPSYNKLVMAGYQGWFAAEGDGSERGWYHYKNSCGFGPGCAAIDFWPDVSEYKKTYTTPFKHRDGSTAYLYSPHDEETVDLHFSWMKQYGIDGVFMQRFVVEVRNEKGKRHFNKVLNNALKAAKKYGRAIGIMYDLSGCSAADLSYIEKDLEELKTAFSLFDVEKNPTYLRHNNKPLISIWGVGFNDNRGYTTPDVKLLTDNLKRKNQAIMLGVPYWWRTLNNDTESTGILHEVIKNCDIIMPWAVGRYNFDTYKKVSEVLQGDIAWCKTNNVDYIPLVFPGFSWGNLKSDYDSYNSIPRKQGDFLWRQVAGAKNAGAQSLYIAMFDEIDEGTAIYKCLTQRQMPLNGERKFVGIEDGLKSDYYLWLSGKAANWFHGAENLNEKKPIRRN